MDGTLYGGVPVSEINSIAQTIHHGINAHVYNGFLVFLYKSNRGHCTESCQIDINNVGKLVRLFGYYPGQWTDAADEFIKVINNKFTFTK